MGQAGSQGEQGPRGPIGPAGKQGVGIKFINYDPTSGNLQIGKTDETVFSSTIIGPPGPPGDYTAEEVSKAVAKDTAFIKVLATNMASNTAASNLIADDLEKRIPFQNRISNLLVSSGNFARSIGENLSLNDSFKEGLSEAVQNTISETNITPLVSKRTIWCDTAANSICSLPTSGTLHIPTGSNSEGGEGKPIVFSRSGYNHFIRTRHNNVVDSNKNAFDFYVNNSAEASTSSAPGTGNKNVMSIHGLGVDVKGDLNITGGTNITGGMSAGNLRIAASTTTNPIFVGGGGRLRIATGTSDYSLIGTNDTDGDDNTRIVVSGKDRSDNKGNIQYVTTGTGQHKFIGDIVFSNGKGIKNASTTYGNITVSGAGNNGWAGYDINDQFVFMANADGGGIHSNAKSWVIYRDTKNDTGTINLGKGWTISTNAAGNLEFKKDNIERATFDGDTALFKYLRARNQLVSEARDQFYKTGSIRDN